MKILLLDFLCLGYCVYLLLLKASVQCYVVFQRWIGAHSPVSRRTVPFQDLLRDLNVTLIPGEIYPPSVHVISTSLCDSDDDDVSSNEPCCGTHISNTAHLQAFVVEDVVSVITYYTF